MSSHEATEEHVTRVVVWDTPATVEPGASFRLKIGVKCEAGCSTAGRRIDVRDAGGQSMAGGSVGAAVWPGTAALHYADVDVLAPTNEGLHAWEAAVAADESAALTHAAASVRLHVRVVRAPQFLLKVVAVDARSGQPVPGAKVVVHPYRAMTDALGVAEIRVARGAYRLFVSGRDRFPFRSDGVVNEDTTIRAELDADLGPSDSELWA